MTRVKICGLTRPQDVDLAVDLGAHAVGFVAHPSSPRALTSDQIRELAQRVPPFVTTVTVFGPYPAEFEISTDLIQGLGNPIHPRFITSWRPEPDLQLPTKPGEALLLDALAADGGGGTGHTVNWDRAAEIVQSANYPVILAGGLDPDNVAEAIRKVRPYAVDVASGTEASKGIKDPGRMRAFFEAVRSATNS
jgi:phosphoribosylanthranilate isomerase